MLYYFSRASGGMVDTLALGASAARRGGSSPLLPTNSNFVFIIKYDIMQLGFHFDSYSNFFS